VPAGELPGASSLETDPSPHPTRALMNVPIGLISRLVRNWSRASQRLRPDRARAASLRQPRFPPHPISPLRPPRNFSPLPVLGANDNDGPSVPSRDHSKVT
jgi:hypothetical protein